MSVTAIQTRMKSIQREIDELHGKLSAEANKEAQKTGKLVGIRENIGRSKSASTIRTKQREAQRLEQEVATVQKVKAALQKRIAKKTSQLHRCQQELAKAQAQEHSDFERRLLRAQDTQARQQRTVLADLRSQQDRAPRLLVASPEYDAFISHASEDKVDLVRPLAEALQANGHDIWYDEFQLKVGDSLRKSIDKGLANSRFGIVVLSPSFFAKNWAEYELNGLVAREMSEGKVILPLWHKVSKDEVLAYSPSLADKKALNTAMFTIEELAKELSSVIRS